MNPPRPRTVPPWDLPTVRALQGLPFEPLQSSSLRVLSLKTTLLLALALVKQVGDLQALSVNPACLEFGPNDSKVILKPTLGYVPKVLSTPFRAQVLMLLLGVAVHHRSKSSFHQRHCLFSGHGPVGCPFLTFVRRLAGPRRPHLQGFTTWMSPPCRPESFLLK